MRKLLASIVLLLCLVLLPVASALAQGPITIARSEASFTFQKEARFTVEATGQNDIVKATVRFRLGDQTAINAVEKTVDPARSVTVEHSWSLSNADLPSGVIITYWWTVEDKAGNQAESERNSFTYLDTRFSWKTLTREDVTLAWYRGDDALGRDLLDSAVKAYQRLAEEFAVPRKPARIYIYGSFDDLRSGIGESAREWTGGRAYPEFDVTLIGVPPGQGEFGRRAVAHEFAHLIVYRVTMNPFSGLPRWLDEGLAMWAEGPLEDEFDRALKQAIKSNQLFSLQSLSSNFPADSKQATLAYAESYSVVTFILKSFGRQKMADLLAAFKEGNTYDGALRRVLNLNTEELDVRWRAELGLPASQPGAESPQGGQVTQPPAPTPARPTALTERFLLLLLAGFGAGAVVILGVLIVVVVLLIRPQRRG